MATQNFYGDAAFKKTVTVTGTITHADGTSASHGATKSQVDASYSNARLRSNHTGTQTVSTISDFATATDSRIDTKIATLVGGAPSTFDTLKEIADWIAANDTTDLIADVAANTSAIDALETAVENLEAGGAGSYKENIGDGAATSFIVTHNLTSFDVAVEVFENTGQRQTVYPVVTRPSTSTILVDFDTTVIPSASHRVVIRVI